MINSQHRSITRGGWGSWLLCRCSAQERREEREQRSAWAPRAGHVDVRHSILMAVDRRAPRSCRPVQQPNETRHSDDFSLERPHAHTQSASPRLLEGGRRNLESARNRRVVPVAAGGAAGAPALPVWMSTVPLANKREREREYCTGNVPR